MKGREGIAKAAMVNLAKITKPPPADCGFCFSCCDFLTKGILRCSVCKFAAYCGAACQKADWKRHKPFCGKADEDAKSMREAVLAEHMRQTLPVLESLTKGGTAPMVMKIHSPAKMGPQTRVHVGFDQRTDILRHFYPEGHKAGAYLALVTRDCMQAIVAISRSPQGRWAFEIAHGMTPLEKIIQFAWTLHQNILSLAQYRAGEMDLLSHVATFSGLTKGAQGETLADKAKFLQKTLAENPEAISSIVEDVRKFAVSDLVDPEASDSSDEETSTNKPAAAGAMPESEQTDVGDLLSTALEIPDIGETLLSVIDGLQKHVNAAAPGTDE